MQITRLRLLAIAFLLAVTPSASASQAIKANDVLLSAMSPFEDMIEFALAESDPDISIGSLLCIGLNNKRSM